MALSTPSLPYGGNVSVVFIEGMAVNTLSPAARDSRGAISPVLVHPSGDRLQVVRIHAVSIATTARTNVIQFQPFRNLSHEKFIAESMGERRTAAVRKLSVTVARQAPSPQPASGGGLVNEGPEAFFSGLSTGTRGISSPLPPHIVGLTPRPCDRSPVASFN